MSLIYLDNNATTRVAGEVLAAMAPFYTEYYGNAHAVHELGRKAHDAVEEARASVAALVGVAPDELVFTSCGTEGNAILIRGIAQEARRAGTPRRKIVTTAVEHPSVLLLLRDLADAGEIDLEVVPVGPDGEIDQEAMRAAIDERTALVSVMLAQNETGVLHPVAEIAAMAHAAGARVHVDAVQAAGKIPLDASALGADFLTISGHKLHAPKGVGALTVRRGLRVPPLWYGGGQEMGLRSGTEAVPSIVGFGAAARLAGEALAGRSEIERRRDRFESALLAADRDVSVNGRTQPRLPNTANVSFHGRAADAIVRALDQRGVFASAGAACHSGKVEPSGTMRAMGKPLDVAMGAVRFSLSRYTTDEEIERAIEIILEILDTGC